MKLAVICMKCTVGCIEETLRHFVKIYEQRRFSHGHPTGDETQCKLENGVNNNMFPFSWYLYDK